MHFYPDSITKPELTTWKTDFSPEIFRIITAENLDLVSSAIIMAPVQKFPVTSKMSEVDYDQQKTDKIYLNLSGDNA